jgi:hypothetical protein
MIKQLAVWCSFIFELNQAWQALRKKSGKSHRSWNGALLKNPNERQGAAVRSFVLSRVTPTAGTATQGSFTGTPPNPGNFRLGLTFTDSAHVYGTAGSTFRYASFSWSSGTLVSSFIPLSKGERSLGLTALAGHPLLASLSTDDNHVSVYELTDPANPMLLGQANATTGTSAANANGTGAIAWGDPVYDPVSQRWSEELVAMSTNDGIQAFLVTIPEPGSFALTILGIGLVAFCRRRRN